MGEDVRWKGEILPGVSLPLHNVWERMYAGRGKSCLGCPYLCIMCGRGCKLEGVSPEQSLPLHNVWERMYAGEEILGVPTSA